MTNEALITRFSCLQLFGTSMQLLQFKQMYGTEHYVTFETTVAGTRRVVSFAPNTSFGKLNLLG